MCSCKYNWIGETRVFLETNTIAFERGEWQGRVERVRIAPFEVLPQHYMI